MVSEPSRSPWDIQRFDKSHERASFDCGKPPLNEWLQRHAGQYERRDLSRTYVGVRKGLSRILGYYAICNHRVSYRALSGEQAKRLPRIDVPVILLGRLAVDKTVQGQGLGQHLLMDALRRAKHLSQHVGVRAVEVDAIDDDARNFYLKYGFASLQDDPHHLFLSMQVIRKLDLVSYGGG